MKTENGSRKVEWTSRMVEADVDIENFTQDGKEKTMLTTTLRKLSEGRMLDERYLLLVEKNPGLGNDDPLPLWRILETNGVGDALWAFRGIPKEQEKVAKKIAVAFAVACAERVMDCFERKFRRDKRVRVAVEAARRGASGDELERAISGAKDAASEAFHIAGFVSCPSAYLLLSAGGAASAAEHAASAVGGNVSAAANDAAEAARNASCAAAWELEGAHRGALGKKREKAWQRETLAKLLKNKGEENENDTIH